jgi:putative inorganic carbon (hco3(-)) transporter
VVLAGPSASATDRGSAAARSLGAVVVVVVAVATGLLSVRTVGRTELILPVAGLAGLTLVILGLRRFEWFVLAVLALRTLVDVTKVGPDSNQLPSSSATASAISSGPAASALAILFIVMATLWLLGRTTNGALSGLLVTDAVFLLFVFSCIVSVVGAVNRVATITETARIIAAVLMFVVLERLLTSLAQVRRVLVAAFIALVAPVGLGLVQVATGHGQFETGGVSRVVGTFLHPNTFGFFLSMFMLMAVALYRHCTARTRLALVAVLVVCGGLLTLTYSRGSWIAFVLGLVVIGVLQSRLVFAWMAAGALGVVALLPAVVARLADLGAGSSVTGSAGNSLTWRFDYWAAVIQLNHDNPVTGIGLKGTKFITDQSKAPHNDFLRAYAETGALGLLAFLAVLVTLGVVARQAVRKAAPGLARGVAVGFAAVFTAYLVDSFGDNLMSEIVVLWYFYAFAACAVAVSRLGPDESDPDHSPASARHARPNVRVAT